MTEDRHGNVLWVCTKCGHTDKVPKWSPAPVICCNFACRAADAMVLYQSGILIPTGPLTEEGIPVIDPNYPKVIHDRH